MGKVKLRKDRSKSCYFIAMFTFIAVNLTFMNASLSSQRTYYVATSGSDENNGSIKRPWATVQHAGRTAKPGDNIFVRGGTYNEGEIWLRKEYGHGGKAGIFLTIKAHPGEKPIFDNGNRPFIVECDYIRIEGLHFTNGKGISIRGLNRNTIHIVNNSFTGSGYAWGAIDTHGDNILIEGNDCDLKGNIVGTQGHCYYIGHGSDITVKNNTAKGMTGYGIHVFDQRRSEDPSNFERVIKGVIIEGNIVSESEQRSGIIIAAYDHARVENIIVRNNIVYNNAGFGIVVPGVARNVKVYNNTVVGNRGGPAFYLKGSVDVVSDLWVKNNIFDITGIQGHWGSLFHVTNENNNPSVILENNLYWPKPPKLKNILDSSPIAENPEFHNLSLKDFHLQRTSGAIDRGLTLREVPFDKDGVGRPTGSAYDIGAYEFH